jgi:two-component system nitrogen regulation response regulator GlnG
MADGVMKPEHLPPMRMPGGIAPADIRGNLDGTGDLSLKEIVERTVRDVEQQVLTKVLKRVGGNKSKAARILHLDYKTVHTKVKKYGINLDA